jgi:homeobox protein ESX1
MSEKPAPEKPRPDPAKAPQAPKPAPAKPRPVKEVGGPDGPEPTRYGDWERKGRVSDF